MKKRLYLIIIMCMVACVCLTGCQTEEPKGNEVESNYTATQTNTNTEIKNSVNNTEEKSNANNVANNTNKTINSTSKTNTTSTNTTNSNNTATKTSTTNNTTNEKLEPTEIKKKYNEDIGLGLEVYHPKVNGREVVVNVQTSGSTEQQKSGPYYIWYEMRIGYDSPTHDKYKLVKEGIYHLEGYGVEMLKEYDEEEDIGVNYEFFEWDLTASAYKGTDKEYVAVSFPAGTEDKSQATLLLATDEGDLVAEFTADVVHDITLTGADVEKYKNHSGDVVFNSIKDGNVTYLIPTEKMYKTDAKGNKVLDTSLDTIELDEYSVTISNGKATSKKTGEIYKITNAKGKTFGFGEFRH